MGDEEVPYFKGEVWVAGAQYSDEVILPGANGTLGFVGTVVVGGDILNLEVEGGLDVGFQGGGGFIVEAFVGRSDAFTEKEGSARLVGGDIVGGSAAVEGFSVDVVCAVHDKDVLGTAFGGYRESASGVGVADGTMVAGEVQELGEDGEGSRWSWSRSGMEVAVGFVKGWVRGGAA